VSEIITRATVPAPPAAVWDRLTLHGPAADWNPRIRFCSPLTPDALATMRVRLFGVWIVVRVRVTDCRRGEALAWTGGLPGLFVGHHQFVLASSEDGGTLLEHSERFEGRLVSALLPLLRNELTSLYAEINAALASG
jgi:hypothetical protein